MSESGRLYKTLEVKIILLRPEYFVLAVDSADSDPGWHVSEDSDLIVVKCNDSEVVELFFGLTAERQLRLQRY